jgi:hypothetical protein
VTDSTVSEAQEAQHVVGRIVGVDPGEPADQNRLPGSVP